MILHILRKDVRRLWPAGAVSLIVLGALAWHDAHRSDQMVGNIESWLNMLVPLAWACLLALAVEQEPIAGDRQFWITRPYRKRDLLFAKLLFAALFVHLPSLAADCCILLARGFSPLAYAGDLIAKQLVLAAALTLPAMALATLVGSFSHFVFELVGLAVAAVLLAMAYWVPQADWEVFETVRRQGIVFLAALAAAAILGLQYLGRRVLTSRGVAVAAGLTIGLFYCFFLPQSALAIRSAVKPARAALSLTVLPAAQSRIAGSAAPGYIMSIPVELGGVPAGTHATVTALRSRISGPGGTFEQSIQNAGRQPYERQPYYLGFTASTLEETAPKWMRVYLDPSVGRTLRDGTVTISGEAAVTLSRTLSPVWMGTSETRDFPGLGRCTTQLIERRFSEWALRVDCESPRNDLDGARVRLWSPDLRRDWNHFFWRPRNFSGAPRMSWLSPLYRSVVYMDLVPEGSQFLYELRIPREAIPNARIEITAREPLGYQPLHFEFRDLELRRYIVAQPIRAVAR